MRNTILTLVFCLFFLSLQAQDFVTIQGQVNNPRNNTVSLQIARNPLDTRDIEKYTDTLSAEGHFEIKFELDVPVPASFVHEGKKYQQAIFIQPGDSMQITYDPSIEKSPEFISFIGDGANDNNFLRTVAPNFVRKNQTVINQKMLRKSLPTSYKAYHDSTKNAQLAALSDYKKNAPISKEFEAHITDVIVYSHALTLMSYPYQRIKLFRNKKDTVTYPINYFSFLEGVDLNNQQAIFTIPQYAQFIDYYVHHHFNEEVIKKSENYAVQNYFVDKFDFAKTRLKDHSLSFILGANFIIGANKGKAALIIPKYEEFKAQNQHPSFQKTVDFHYNLHKKYLPGAEASNFTVVDSTGKEVKLSDFKGKVVYMDFWATWCGPCRRQMPHSKKLKKHFEGQEVAFLYISVDKDEAKWKAFLDKEQLEGHHYHAPKDRVLQIKRDYMVQGIPKFVLIDQEGKLVDFNAKRPDNPQIYKEIEGLMKKN